MRSSRVLVFLYFILYLVHLYMGGTMMRKNLFKCSIRMGFSVLLLGFIIGLVALVGFSMAGPLQPDVISLRNIRTLNHLDVNLGILESANSVNLLSAIRMNLPKMMAGVCWDYMIYVDRCSRCPVEIQLCVPVAAGFKTCFPGIVVTYCTTDKTTCTFDEDYPGGGTCQFNPR